jgi:FKBP-type peptidyl-prolyl cis-trans isomerase FkpA
MKLHSIVVLGLAIALVSCESCQRDIQQQTMTQQEMDDKLLELNRQFVQEDKAMIAAYIQEKEWPTSSTGTGLQYWIYEEGKDTTKAKEGMTARIRFAMQLLDGTEVYQTPEGVVQDFVIAHADVETGIHEIVLLMSPGDRAKAILPPHLAYGLTGDMAKIPLQSALVYDIQLLALK